MKRPLAPTVASPRPRYPRLALGWRILVAASPLVGAIGVAHGDTSVPAPSKPEKPPQKGDEEKPPGKSKPDHPRMGGKMVSPKIDPWSFRMRLHPHEPGAPCFTDDDEEAA
jgi:hypothetical protein